MSNSDASSPSGYGWTTDELSPFFPGTPCVHCGKFVGRDGIFNVEYWEMTNEIASMDAEHHECLERAQQRWRQIAESWRR